MSTSLVPAGADLAPLAAIHAASFADDGWSARALSDLLATPGAFLISREGGFILVRAAADEAEILTLAVHPQARRKGIGLSLVAAAASHAQLLGAKVLFLEVAAGNIAARSLYRWAGFAETGRRKGYYTAGRRAPEDALVLRSALPLSPLGNRPLAG